MADDRPIRPLAWSSSSSHGSKISRPSSSSSSMTTSAIRGGVEFLESSLPLKAHVTIGAPPRKNRITSAAFSSSDISKPPSSAERVFGSDGEVISDESSSQTGSSRVNNSSARSSSLQSAYQHRHQPRTTIATASSVIQPHGNFCHPPGDPSGIICDASDRPLLCMHVQGQEVVVGGADHALYCYDIETGKPLRRLYTKTHGHIDWVSTLTHLDDGRILSGGGDGKVCLWPSERGTICHDLDGHASAVAKVANVPNSRLAFSAGYDGKIKLWDMGSRRMLTCMDGLEPVMDFHWGGNELVGGTRKGTCQVWDLKRAELVRSIKAHRGHVTCVLHWYTKSEEDQQSAAALSSSTFMTGGQDGIIKVWDARGEGCLHRIECHASADRGTGAVSCLIQTGDLIATAGADKRVCVLEPRASFRPLHVFEEHTDFIYSLYAVGEALFSGAGNGMMLCHHLSEGCLLYGLGANQGAVRAIASHADRLVVAGDDGKAIIYTHS